MDAEHDTKYMERQPGVDVSDAEKQVSSQTRTFELSANEVEWTDKHGGKLGAVTHKLLTWGVETRGE